MSDAPVGVNSFPDQPREPILGQKEARVGPEAPAPSLLVSSLQSLEVVSCPAQQWRKGDKDGGLWERGMSSMKLRDTPGARRRHFN